MNKDLNNTEKLIQKIVDRQAELVVLSTAIFKSEPKKQSKINYTWFQEFENKIDVFKLSKAV